MWHFGSGGLNIFSPDGSKIVKELGADKVCHNTTGYGGSGWRVRCDFYDVVSDGKKYVFAATARGVAKINVFEIDTGNIVGALPACESPNDLDYHSLRDEVWIRCRDQNKDGSYLDVVSASGLSSDIATNITFTDDDVSSRGYVSTDPSLGDVGYATDRDSPFLYKIDLSERKVMDDGKIPIPLANGAEELAYSKANGHIFVRSTVCCTCGFEGADNGPDCGRYGGENVTVTTGPFASPDIQTGQCNSRCEGNANTDILGVYEIDSRNDKVVAQHVMLDGVGGDPYPSPDGKHIVMLGRNGGTSIRVLATGAPGKPSTVFADLKLGFNSTTYEEDQVFNDYAFIDNDGKKMIVFAAGTENKVAIIDVTDGTADVTYVTFSEGPLTSYRERRQVEWAVGTNYVWVDGAGNDEVYVIDVMSKSLVNTISNVETTRLLSVDNHARNVQNSIMQEYIESMITADREANPPQVIKETTQIVKEVEETQTVSAQSATGTTEPYEDDNDIDLVGIVGLVLGAVAIVVGAMNLAFLSKMKSPTGIGAGAVRPGDDEEVTLGSKDVA